MHNDISLATLLPNTSLDSLTATLTTRFAFYFRKQQGFATASNSYPCSSIYIPKTRRVKTQTAVVALLVKASGLLASEVSRSLIFKNPFAQRCFSWWELQWSLVKSIPRSASEPQSALRSKPQLPWIIGHHIGHHRTHWTIRTSVGKECILPHGPWIQDPINSMFFSTRTFWSLLQKLPLLIKSSYLHRYLHPLCTSSAPMKMKHIEI